MRKIRSLIVVWATMMIVSIICLLGVSTFTYTYKWQADKALIGITVTYIITGFFGGLVMRIQNKDEKSMGRKMLEAIFLSVVFMLLLVVLSAFVMHIPFEFSSRFLMIFMLLTGSSCLGRIL